jgi:hypothetical protein
MVSHCDTDLSRAFFSKTNLDAIQKELKVQIHHATGHIIDRQSDAEITGIMKGVYEAFSNNEGGKEEIKRLNDIVLDILVDQVKAGVQGYLTYLKDASTMPQPLSRGTFASIKGERSIEYKVGFK